MDFEPTKRAVIDVGRKCNINCRFCYYSHLGDLTKQGFEKYEDLQKEIGKAYSRGCNYIDITGGEPTIYPKMAELIKYALDNYNIKTCVITNAQCGENTIQKLLDAGVDDFLVSIHGMKKTHDYLTQREGARDKQIKFLDYLSNKNFKFRFNCVMNVYNQNELPEIAAWASNWDVKIFNFINFNPHNDWAKDKKGTQDTIANLDILEKGLNSAIDILESRGIGVNVRYYPMCKIDPEFRKNICNDLHVSFDPYEWDYAIEPKTPEKHLNWAITGSKSVERGEYPCSYICSLKGICGGINRHYYEAIEDKDKITPVSENLLDKYDFMQYRVKNNLIKNVY